MTDRQETALHLTLILGVILGAPLVAFGWFFGYVATLKVVGAAALFGCWFLLLLWPPYGSAVAAIIFAAVLGSAMYAVNKDEVRHREECHAAGGDSVSGRGFRACLAKGTILRP
jgi:hypothetical protein